MNFQLVKEENKTRIYRNAQGTEIKTIEIYTDPQGVKWFGFVDLFKIPVIRSIMARHITDLYGIGLTIKDLLNWCKEEKALIRGNDPEKYEKLYSLILEKEKLATFVADPIKQNLALCTVYILKEDERIDYFDEDQAQEKMKYWALFPEMVAFFLTWHTNHIQRYIKTLDRISKTVSTIQKNQPQISQQGKRLR